MKHVHHLTLLIAASTILSHSQAASPKRPASPLAASPVALVQPAGTTKAPTSQKASRSSSKSRGKSSGSSSSRGFSGKSKHSGVSDTLGAIIGIFSSGSDTPTVRYQTPSTISRSSRSSTPTVRYQAPSTSSRSSTPTVRYQTPSTSSRSSTPTVRYQTPSTSSRSSTPTVRYQAPSTSSRSSTPTVRYQAPSTSHAPGRTTVNTAPSISSRYGTGTSIPRRPANTGRDAGRPSSFIDLGDTSSSSGSWRMPSLYGARARTAASGRSATKSSDTTRSYKPSQATSTQSSAAARRAPEASGQGSENARNTLREALLDRYRAGGKPSGARTGLNTTLGKRYGTRTTRAGSPSTATGSGGNASSGSGKSPVASKPLSKPGAKLNTSAIPKGSLKSTTATKLKGNTSGAPGARPKAGGRWSGMSPERAAQVRALAKRRTAFTPTTAPKKVRYDNMKIGAMDGLAQTGLKVGSGFALGLVGAPRSLSNGFSGYGGYGGYGSGKGSYWDNYNNNCWSNWWWNSCWSYWDCWSSWGPWFCWGPSFSWGCSSYYSSNFWWPSYSYWGPSYPSSNTTIVYANDPAPVEVTVIVDGPREDVVVLAGEGALVVDESSASTAPPIGSDASFGAPAQPLGRAAEYYLSLGDQAFADGRYDTAAQLYTRAVQYAPDQGILHLILADALFATGDYSPAAAHLRTALALDPLLTSTPFDKHGLYTDPTDFDRQLATLELFLRDHPLVEDARLVLAFNLLFGGRPAAAVELLEEPFSASLRSTLTGALLLETGKNSQYG